jgi:hypothetical protein
MKYKNLIKYTVGLIPMAAFLFPVLVFNTLMFVGLYAVLTLVYVIYMNRSIYDEANGMVKTMAGFIWLIIQPIEE